MAVQRLRVEARAMFDLELENYADDWHAKCDEDADEPLTSYPPVSLEFALERFQEQLEEDGDSFAEVFEGATIDVEADE